MDGRFRNRNELRLGKSNDNASVAVPARSPAVSTSRRVPRDPCDVRHRTDVSDHHSVDSHAVSPSRPADVYRQSPRFDPCTVTLADPVPARFARVDTLTIAVSNDQTSVRVSVRSPEVTMMRLVALSPVLNLHNKEVADTHDVNSLAVSPILED